MGNCVAPTLIVPPEALKQVPKNLEKIDNLTLGLIKAENNREPTAKIVLSFNCLKLQITDETDSTVKDDKKRGVMMVLWILRGAFD